MELKPVLVLFSAADSPLLIVPYGIETFFHGIACLLHHLLIVPYGIETPFPA